MAGVYGLKEGHGLFAAHFAQDDAVRSHAQCRGQQDISAARGLIAVRHQRDDIRLCRAQLCGLFDRDDALVGRHEGEDFARCDSLASRGAAGDDHVELVRDAELDRGVDVAGGHDIAQLGIALASCTLVAALFAEQDRTA